MLFLLPLALSAVPALTGTVCRRRRHAERSSAATCACSRWAASGHRRTLRRLATASGWWTSGRSERRSFSPRPGASGRPRAGCSASLRRRARERGRPGPGPGSVRLRLGGPRRMHEYDATHVRAAQEPRSAVRRGPSLALEDPREGLRQSVYKYGRVVAENRVCERSRLTD